MSSHDRPPQLKNGVRDNLSGDRHTDRGAPLVAGTALALTVTRWLLPAEATAEGDSLWIALVWLAMGGFYGLWKFWIPGQRRFDGADLAAALFIGGHVVSGCIVLTGDGNRRAALNLIWEWLSLGVLWIVWRDLLQAPRHRTALIAVMLTTAVTLSAWGMWQYFDWYPQMAAKYGPKFDELRQLEAVGRDAAALKRELHEAGIPFEGGARDLFENRLRNSREPFGPFALANTFGGLLTAWLVLGGVLLLVNSLSPKAGEKGQEKQPPHPSPLPRSGGEGTGIRSPLFKLGAWLLLALIAGCLYLTNSRTAWAGALVAGLAWGLVIVNQRIVSRRGRTVISAIGAGMGVLAAAGVLWIVMQGEQLVPGPLKSLSYRAEYWIGTWRMLKPQPWLGIGLGQFRDHYLQFKLPETSEEIADPHNLVLDVWSNGGAVALAGLCGLLGCLSVRLWRLMTRDQVMVAEPAGMVPWRDLFAGFAGFAVAIVGQLATLGVWDSQMDQMAVFSVVWLAAAWLFRMGLRVSDHAVTAGSALAALALSIHLCGAGGIAMPAVAQTWLLLMLLAWTPRAVEGAERNAESSVAATTGGGLRRSRALVLSASGFVLAMGCFWTSYWPVTQRRHLLDAAELAATRGGDQETARRLYHQAAQADPLAWEAWEQLASWEFALANRSSAEIDRVKFDAAVEAEQKAIQRSPHRPQGYQQLAEFRAELARRSRNPDDWNQSISAYRAAATRHPTSARLLAEFALVLAEAEQAPEAANEAQRAIAQDDLNHRRGHTDRYLPEKQRERLLKLAEFGQ